MSWLSTVLKLFVSLLVVVPLLAATFLDINFRDSEFKINEQILIKTAKSAKSENFDREVASAWWEKEDSAPVSEYVALNNKNTTDINGTYKVVTFIDHLGDSERINGKQVQVQLVGTSLVTLNNIPTQKYIISIFQKSSSFVGGHNLVIFRSYLDGYEILELIKIKNNNNVTPKIKAKIKAKRISSVQRISSKNIKHSDLNVKDAKTDNDLNKVIDLVIDKVVTPKGKSYDSRFASGRIEIMDGTVSIDVSINDYSGQRPIITEIRILNGEQNGNSFVATANGETFLGIMNFNGNMSFLNVRFSTGPYKGLSLSFATDEEVQKRKELIESRGEFHRNEINSFNNHPVAKIDNQKKEESSSLNNEIAKAYIEELNQELEEDEQLTEEEKAIILKQEGFNFKNN